MRLWFYHLIALALLVGFIHVPRVYGQSHAEVYLDDNRSLTQFAHRYWDADDGLPQNSINAIANTHDEFLWLGTQEGLVRFDGLEFKVFNRSNEDAFRSDDIRVLTLDSRGVLWVGTRDAGLLRYRDGVFTEGAIDSTLDKARITTIQPAQEGTYTWVGTSSEGVWKVRNGEAEKVENLPSEAITSLVETRNGVLWIGTRDAGLLHVFMGEVTQYSTSTGFSFEDITALVLDHRSGILWVGTREKGVYSIDGEDTQHYSQATGLPSDKILSLYLDETGSVWVGTDQSGLARITFPSKASVLTGESDITYKISFMDSERGFSGDVVKAIYSDNTGNMWIGTDGGGLNMLQEGKFLTYTAYEGLVDDFVFSIHEDASKAVWFSTQKGVSRLKDGEINTFTAEQGLAMDFVTSVDSWPDSTVWLGTYGGGLNRYKEGKFSVITDKDGLPDNGIFALYTDSKGVLWIGTGGGIATYQDGITRTITEEDGLSSDLVTVIMESQDGSMWVGTYNAGLNRVLDDEIIPFTVNDGLSSDAVLSLYMDDDDVIWVGTYGGGLNRIEDGVVTTYSTKEGLYNDNVVQIFEDRQGNLWMSCNKGLFKVKKEELNAFAEGEISRITSVTFDKSDGLKSPEFNGGIQPAGWVAHDGTFWFPSSKGVAVVNPEDIPSDEKPPSVKIDNLVLDRDLIEIEAELTLDPGDHDIEFHYFALSFVAPEKTTYRYKLEGADEEWVDAGQRRTAYYTNLDPGWYTFNVVAVNGDGVESAEPAQISFYLKPYFYQTIWFYLVTVSALVFFGYLTYKRRMAQIREKEKELERLVEDRTRVLEKRTVDLLETLEQNKEIMGITSHDLKNPLGGIIGLADMLLEDLQETEALNQLDESIENVELVKNEAERMLRIIKDLLDKHREGGDTILKKEFVDLLALTNDVLRWNTQKAAQKNINITLSEAGQQIVFADPDALLRVIDNLVSNAVKYSLPGRRVWVTISEVYGEVLLQVLDEGPGLTKEDLGRVFGKMQRLSAKPTAGEHSTGLGLYIVKQLVEEHGGEVGVDSVYGQGATFWFKLPLYEGPNGELKQKGATGAMLGVG